MLHTRASGVVQVFALQDPIREESEVSIENKNY
jgi:hypothetical protein